MKAVNFLKHSVKAKGAHQIHSPFVFELYTEVFHNDSAYYAFEALEEKRTHLLQSKDEIEVTDFGAGSKIFKDKIRPVSGIAKHVVKGAKYSQLLFRIVEHFKPATIIELGTSLGLTTLYLSLPNPKAEVHTLEGCPNTLAHAKKTFTEFPDCNIIPHEGPFTTTLTPLLKQLNQVDFIFIDGHHEEKATLAYFEQCLEHIHNDSVIILDDIHWSEGMEKAWQSICERNEVSVSIDLYQLGLVFFRKEQPKQHFQLRF